MAGTAKTAAQLNTEVDTLVASAQSPPIAALAMRQVLQDMIASSVGMTSSGVVASPNTVMAGPASGVDTGFATFRSLVSADIPAFPAAPIADYINLKSFGAVGDGITDDTLAVIAWITALQLDLSRPLAGFAPAGRYLIKGATPLPLITSPIAIYGAGSTKTWFILDSTFSGDLFRASNTWISTGQSGTSVNFTVLRWGLILSNFSITGTRLAAGQQNAIQLYDINDLVRIENIDVTQINGRGLCSGYVLQNTSGGLNGIACNRESRYQNLHFWHCGGATAPVVEFNTHGTTDGSNEIDIDGILIYQAGGTGFLIQNSATGSNTVMTLFRITRLRVEATGSTSPVAFDSVVIDAGNPPVANGIMNIEFDQCTLLNTYDGQAALRIKGGTSPTTAPAWIRFHGIIWHAQGTGLGIVVESGRFLTFECVRISPTGSNTAFTLGSSTTVAAPIILNGFGREYTFIESVDATSTYALGRPAIFYGAQNAKADMYQGTGTPEAVVTGNPGSLFFRTDSQADLMLYAKETGGSNTGWRAVQFQPTQLIGQTTVGTTQADALALTGYVNEILSAPNTNTGAVLPTLFGSRLPRTVIVINNSVQNGTFKLYPNVGADIDGGTIDAPIVVASDTRVTLVCTSQLHWYTTAVSP